jgi:hypothetical protein
MPYSQQRNMPVSLKQGRPNAYQFITIKEITNRTKCDLHAFLPEKEQLVIQYAKQAVYYSNSLAYQKMQNWTVTTAASQDRTRQVMLSS